MTNKQFTLPNGTALSYAYNSDGEVFYKGKKIGQFARSYNGRSVYHTLHGRFYSMYTAAENILLVHLVQKHLQSQSTEMFYSNIMA